MKIHKKLNIKLTIWGISCLIFLLILGCAIFHYLEKSKYNNVPYEKVVFSNTKYPKEQQQVMELLKKEYSFENFSTKNIAYEKRARMTIYPEDIFISRINLNNDKILDVIVWVTGTEFNGTRGSPSLFYIIDEKGVWKKVLDVYSHNFIIIFNKMHYGLRDIAFMSFDNIGDQKAGRNIWTWNGKIYDRMGLYPLQKIDWEVFKDD